MFPDCLDFSEEKVLKSITCIPVIGCVTRGGTEFTLRPFLPDDGASLVEHINSSHISERVSNVPSPYTTEHAQAWLLRMRQNNLLIERGEKPDRIDFAICIDNLVVGSVAFIDIKDHMAQVSYWLSRNHQGRGIMAHAVSEVVSWGLHDCGFVRIWGYTWSDNRASQKVLERASFILEGVHRKVWPKNGKFYDSHMYAIVV